MRDGGKPDQASNAVRLRIGIRMASPMNSITPPVIASINGSNKPKARSTLTPDSKPCHLRRRRSACNASRANTPAANSTPANGSAKRWPATLAGDGRISARHQGSRHPAGTRRWPARRTSGSPDTATPGGCPDASVAGCHRARQAVGRLPPAGDAVLRGYPWARVPSLNGTAVHRGRNGKGGGLDGQ